MAAGQRQLITEPGLQADSSAFISPHQRFSPSLQPSTAGATSSGQPHGTRGISVQSSARTCGSGTRPRMASAGNHSCQAAAIRPARPIGVARRTARPGRYPPRFAPGRREWRRRRRRRPRASALCPRSRAPVHLYRSSARQPPLTTGTRTRRTPMDSEAFIQGFDRASELPCPPTGHRRHHRFQILTGLPWVSATGPFGATAALVVPEVSIRFMDEDPPTRKGGPDRARP